MDYWEADEISPPRRPRAYFALVVPATVQAPESLSSARAGESRYDLVDQLPTPEESMVTVPRQPPRVGLREARLSGRTSHLHSSTTSRRAPPFSGRVECAALEADCAARRRRAPSTLETRAKR